MLASYFLPLNMITISELHSIFLKSSGITTDSRNCPNKSIFFALKGESFNGNRYANDALIRGCEFAVVDEDMGTKNSNIFIVENVLNTLQKLANYHRRQLNTPLLAITGTNGKTTTKELVNAVVSSSLNVIATEGNLNNHIGVPLTLLRLKKEHQFGIIEMGANHVGEIAELCEIAEPNIGLITNVGKAHLEGFGSFEGVRKTKAELYQYLTKCKGEIILNIDNCDLVNMVGESQYLPYSSKSKKGLIQCTSYKVTPYLEVRYQTDSSNIEYLIKSQLVGSYNLENILAAITVGKILDIEFAKINAAIENYIPTNNRSQLTETDNNTLLIDCYNANPSSMNVALQNFKEVEHPNKMIILGEMRELGESSIKEHSKLIEWIEESCITDVYLVGDEFLKLYPLPLNIHHFRTSDDLLIHLNKEKQKDKMILIKGSRGNKLEKVLSAL